MWDFNSSLDSKGQEGFDMLQNNLGRLVNDFSLCDCE